MTLNNKLLKMIDKYKYVIAVIFVGMIFVCFPSGEEKQKAEEGQYTAFDIKVFEGRIEEALSMCADVGRCEVVLSVESGIERVYAKDSRKSVREENDFYESDSDTKPSIMSAGSGTDLPVFIKEKYPQFRGAAVVCDGADITSVKNEVITLVASLTGLSSERISVVRMRQ